MQNIGKLGYQMALLCSGIALVSSVVAISVMMLSVLELEWTWLWIGSFSVSVCAGAIGCAWGCRLGRKARALSVAAQQMEQGNFRFDLLDLDRDELGDAARSMRLAGNALQKRIAATELGLSQLVPYVEDGTKPILTGLEATAQRVIEQSRHQHEMEQNFSRAFYDSLSQLAVGLRKRVLDAQFRASALSRLALQTRNAAKHAQESVIHASTTGKLARQAERQAQTSEGPLFAAMEQVAACAEFAKQVQNQWNELEQNLPNLDDDITSIESMRESLNEWAKQCETAYASCEKIAAPGFLARDTLRAAWDLERAATSYRGITEHQADRLEQISAQLLDLVPELRTLAEQAQSLSIQAVTFRYTGKLIEPQQLAPHMLRIPGTGVTYTVLDGDADLNQA